MRFQDEFTISTQQEASVQMQTVRWIVTLKFLKTSHCVAQEFDFFMPEHRQEAHVHELAVREFTPIMLDYMQEFRL